MKQKSRYENTILPNLGRTAKLAGFYFIDTFHANGIDLSKEQWLVLKKLNDNDGQSQNDLASITNRTKTSLTRLINTMEKKALVYRALAAEDKRINHIHLSEQGKQTFMSSLPVIRLIMEELQEDISNKDLSVAIQVLGQIQKNIIKKSKSNRSK